MILYNPIRISVVSYLNSLPFVYGLENQAIRSEIILEKDIPSECANKIIERRSDIGLVPVAILPSMPEYYFAGEFGIAADGDVQSVLLLSEVPLSSIQKIYLDYQSRTSVMLARLLCSGFWNIKPFFENASPGFEELISGDTAAVVIGDRALIKRKKYSHVYDLAGEWKKFTGLPFVFAAWVSNHKLPDDFAGRFNEALSFGVNHIREMVAEMPEGTLEKQELLDYLLHRIKFRLDDRMNEGLELFLKMIRRENETELSKLRA